MNVLTHTMLGLLAALLFLPEASGAKVLLFTFMVLVGALLPDVDHPDSFINERLGITHIFSWLFHHRGLLHGLFGILLFGGIAWYFNNFIAYAIVIGYISHLIGDALTSEGIHPIPFIDLRIHGPIRTGSTGEHAICALIFACIAFILYKAV